MQFTQHQVSALPSRVYGPTAAPPIVKKQFLLAVTRKAQLALPTARRCVFVLVADLAAAIPLEV